MRDRKASDHCECGKPATILLVVVIGGETLDERLDVVPRCQECVKNLEAMMAQVREFVAGMNDRLRRKARGGTKSPVTK